MADHVVIRVERLGKKYIIGHEAERERYVALRDVIARAARGAWRRTTDMAHGRAIVAGDSTEEFWALKDVSFEVKRGEVLGIIGRNGAGKSTLLKILSRITEPTEGRVTIKGRVASLLEVGTGFHPELTGRENIYLNGAILGMKRVEIKRKFDEIVSFAEVERFLDTPVKRYSSGMYVRLAFAVAAHLEPEILIVDEVLAVGDAEFQKKCLGKLGYLAGFGRTVIFVSHSMVAISQLCQRGIVLASGAAMHDADIRGAIKHYRDAGALESEGYIDLEASAPMIARGNREATFTSFRIRNSRGKTTAQLDFGDPISVEVGIKASRRLNGAVFGFSFISADGREFQGTTAQDGGIGSVVPAGRSAYECFVDPMILAPGTYYLRAAIYRPGTLYHYIEEFLRFEVLSVPQHRRCPPSHNVVGDIYVPYQWRHLTDQSQTAVIDAPGMGDIR